MRGMRSQGAYAGIEDHVPEHRNPPLPLGTHGVRVKSAYHFQSRKGNRPVTVVEMEMTASEDAPNSIGQTFTWFKCQDTQWPQYYLADVRGFVAAALRKDIEDVDAECAEDAINHRDDKRPGVATGKKLAVYVSPNDNSATHPNVQFIAL